MKKNAACGFTLIELLVVLAILALLINFSIPAIGKLIEKGRSVACLSNLRQIGISASLYANDNNQVFPTIEAWPSDPIYTAEDGAETMAAALGPYGVNEQVLKCSEDISGPNYHKKEGSSYEWCPMANGQRLQSVRLRLGGSSNSIPLSELLLAFDYSGVHNGRYNILYGDGHVAAAK